MKKHLVLSIAFLATAFAEVVSAPSCVPNHGGFYVGAGAGFSAVNVETESYKYIFSGNTASKSKKISNTKSGFSSGIKAGYGWQIDNWYFAPEIELLWNSVKVKNNMIDVTINNASVLSEKLQAELKSQYKYSGNIGFKVGYAFGNHLSYLKTGVSFAKFDSDITLKDEVNGVALVNYPLKSNKVSTTHTGWLIGVGYEYAFTNNWIGFIDFACTLYNKKDLKFTSLTNSKGVTTNINNPDDDKISMKPKTVATTLVGVKYKI